MATELRHTLPGRDYHAPEVFELERDRVSRALWTVAVAVWACFLFANLDEGPEPLLDALGTQDQVPLALERFGPLGELRSGFRTVTAVAANWKILVENYNECLHCPTVHPELVAMVPAYARGEVYEEGREDGGVTLAGGGSGYTRDGRSPLPVLPGFGEAEAGSIYSASIFPNMFLDISPTSAITTCLQPTGPEQTTVVTDYLFRPEAIAAPGFDPREVVEFSELVAHQDYVVCERVQQGVRSRAFTHGVYAEKDELPLAFNRSYLAARDS